MRSRLIQALLLLIAVFGQQAVAQTRPSDVAAYVPVAPQFAGPGQFNLPVDPAVTPPPFTEFTDIPAQASDIITAGPYGNGTGFCLTTYDGGSCAERKFRTFAEPTVVLNDDPIRNPGAPGTSHCHMFFGSGSINAYSTFASLRNGSTKSKAMGRTANGTGYWMPCLILQNPFGDGKDYVVKPDYIVIYYLNGSPTAQNMTTRLRLGERYVAGFDMDDPNKTWLQQYLDTANTANGCGPGATGCSPRYTLMPPQSGWVRNIAHGYTCGVGSSAGGAFVNSDGSDPFGGHCTAGSHLIIQFDSASCWDGTNAWSTGGYKHVLSGIMDAQGGPGGLSQGWVCPKNYYQHPQLELQIQYTLSNGFADLQKARLASDPPMAAGVYTGTMTGHDYLGNPYTVTLRRGETFHNDWFNGWDKTALTTWSTGCTGTEHTTGHECSDNIISSTQVLNGNNASLGNAHGTATAGAMVLVPPMTMGPYTGHTTH